MDIISAENPRLLQRYSFFGGLEEAQIQKILPFMEKSRYAEDQCIIHQGERNDSIRFILQGHVAIEKNGIRIAELNAGQTIGEMEVLDIMPAEASVRALEDTYVMSISNRNLHAIYKEDVQTFAMLIMNLARDLSRRLRAMDQKAAPESPVTEWG